MFVGKNLWVAVTDMPFIPKNKFNNVVKLPKYFNGDETKKTSYDLKANNILITVLSAKVYSCISPHKTS